MTTAQAIAVFVVSAADAFLFLYALAHIRHRRFIERRIANR